MFIRNLITGEIGLHSALFRQTSFDEAGPTQAWLESNNCELYTPPAYSISPEMRLEQIAASEAQRIENLWQQAHEYEYSAISGSAIGLITLGIMQSKPKCIAVQNWIKSIWTLYYTKKADATVGVDFSSCGPCPHSVPELIQELNFN